VDQDHFVCLLAAQVPENSLTHQLGYPGTVHQMAPMDFGMLHIQVFQKLNHGLPAQLLFHPNNCRYQCKKDSSYFVLDAPRSLGVGNHPSNNSSTFLELEVE
jgi:hypothetical protein